MTQQELPGMPSNRRKKDKKEVVTGEWHVPSFTSDKEYVVTRQGSKWLCECPHFQSKKKVCKHIRWQKQRLGLIKEDLSGYKSAIQKSVRRGDLALLKLSFGKLWELDRRWVLWRIPVICAEESERFVGMSGRISEREDAWHLLASMAISPKSKESEGLRVASHIIVEEGWNSEDWLQGERLFQLRSWMDVQSRFQAAGKDKRLFWEWFEKHFQVSEGYVRETFVTCKKRSGMRGMIGDVELMICVGWMCTLMSWPEQEQVQVPAETDVEPAKELPWYVFDTHTIVGKMAHSQLRGVIQDKKEWKYVTDDLQFNLESAKVDRLAADSFWWPTMLRMLWKKYGKTEPEAKEDWQVWRPRIKALVEKRMANQHG